MAANAAKAGETPAQMARSQNARVQQSIDTEMAKNNGHTGEQFGWQVNWFMGSIMRGCRAWPDDTWLEPTEKSLLKLAGTMEEGPDGYKGFIGPYIYNPTAYWVDVHVSDSILIKHMLEFAMIIKENPALREKYGESADLFTEIGKKHLIEKWEKRGTLVVDGPFAGYKEWDMFCKPDDIKGEWFREPNARQGGAPMPCIPFNKAMDMATCMLQIYYVTGEESYKDIATKIHTRFKASLNRFNEYYTWNYWEPISMNDTLNPPRPPFGVVKHWVGTHPNRPYQHGELSNILFAYNMGIVYTDDDMRRFVRTNLTAMWNGDKEAPKWANSDSRLPDQPASALNPSEAGTLWSVLAPFDATILELRERVLGANDVIGRKEIENIKAAGVGFKRKYAPDVVVEELPWSKDIGENTGGQMFAVALPSVVAEGEETTILAKVIGAGGEVEILVRPAEGGELKSIGRARPGGGVISSTKWDGKIDGVRTPGEYVLIWRYNGGERSWPVTVR